MNDQMKPGERMADSAKTAIDSAMSDARRQAVAPALAEAGVPRAASHRRPAADA